MKKFVLSIALIGAANAAVAATESTTVAPNAAAISAMPAAASTSTTAEKAGLLPKKWSASGYAHAVLTEDELSNDDTSANWGDIVAKVSRDIGKGQSLALSGVWLRNQSLGDRTDEILYFDTYLIYSNSNYFGSTFRTNIPTGEWSRKIGRHEFRYDAGTDLAKFGKNTVSYAGTVRRYLYTQEDDGQRSWRLYNSVAFTHEANSVFSPFAALSLENHWRNSGTGIGLNLELPRNSRGQITTPENYSGDFGLELGVGITPVKGVSIEPSINHSREVSRRDAIDLFNVHDTAYEVELTVSM